MTSAAPTPPTPARELAARLDSILDTVRQLTDKLETALPTTTRESE